MFGYRVGEFGGPEVMVWQELPNPSPGPNQVCVKIHASGVNFAETRMRAGTYTGIELPFIMGMEGAGVVHSVGEGVTGFQPGDRVFGRARGCHAEQVVFDAGHLLPLPENLSFVEGAAIPVGWLTAWHALTTVVQIQKGQRVLIEAVASSVGSAALQIAKSFECWVAGTASQDGKLVHAIKAGADLVVNYKQEDLVARVLEATSNKGIDIGMMTIGEETLDSLVGSMGMDGKIIMYGSTSGRELRFNLSIGIQNLQLLSMSISTSPAFVPTTMNDFRERALPRFADGTYEPVVGEVLPISELARSHRMIDDRKHYGKVILEVS